VREDHDGQQQREREEDGNGGSIEGEHGFLLQRMARNLAERTGVKNRTKPNSLSRPA
jgi:hypothetical protein